MLSKHRKFFSPRCDKQEITRFFQSGDKISTTCTIKYRVPTTTTTTMPDSPATPDMTKTVSIQDTVSAPITGPESTSTTRSTTASPTQAEGTGSGASSNTSISSNSKFTAPPPQNQNGSSPWCHNCQTSTTPLWRRNEYGQILCNACGLFLKLHGRPRPISLKTNVIKSRNRNKVSNGTGSGTDKDKTKNKTGTSKPRKRQSLKRQSPKDTNQPSTVSSNPSSNPGSRSTTPAFDPTSNLTGVPSGLQLGPTKVEADLIDSLAHLKKGNMPYPPGHHHDPEPGTSSISLPPIHNTDSAIKRTALPSLRDSPLLSPLINSYSSNQTSHMNGLQHGTSKLPDSLSSNIHIHSTSTHGSGVLASLRASYHGTPIADSIISNPLKTITSPLLLATSNNSKNNLPNVISSLALKNSDLSSTQSHAPSQTSALDQLTKAACTSPYLAPIPQSLDSKPISDKKPVSAPSNPSSLSTILSIESPPQQSSTNGTNSYKQPIMSRFPSSTSTSSLSNQPISQPLTSLTTLKNPMTSMMASAPSMLPPVNTQSDPNDTGKLPAITSITSSISTGTASATTNSSARSSRSPPLSSASPLETRISELEFVNDLLRTRVSELEHYGFNAHLDASKTKLEHKADNGLKARVAELEAKVSIYARDLQLAHDQLAQERKEFEKVQSELTRLKESENSRSTTTALENKTKNIKLESEDTVNDSTDTKAIKTEPELEAASLKKRDTDTAMLEEDVGSDGTQETLTETSGNEKYESNSSLTPVKSEPEQAADNSSTLSPPLKKIKV